MSTNTTEHSVDFPEDYLSEINYVDLDDYDERHSPYAQPRSNGYGFYSFKGENLSSEFHNLVCSTCYRYSGLQLEYALLETQRVYEGFLNVFEVSWNPDLRF